MPTARCSAGTASATSRVPIPDLVEVVAADDEVGREGRGDPESSGEGKQHPGDLRHGGHEADDEAVGRGPAVGRPVPGPAVRRRPRAAGGPCGRGRGAPPAPSRARSREGTARLVPASARMLRADTVPPSARVTNRYPFAHVRQCRCDVCHNEALRSRERSTTGAPHGREPAREPALLGRPGKDFTMRPAPLQTRTPSGPFPAAPRGLRALCSPAALAGGLTELAWLGAHALMYPLGARTEALRPDPRIRPGAPPPAARALFADDPLAARIPVLLVHGLVDNRSVFTVMQRNLRRRGFAQVCSWNYSPFLGDTAAGAADLGEHIERICAQTGHDRMHVIGHSLGGLIARYHVQRQGGDRRVASLVTLGTPHQGSLWAHLLPTPLVRQLRPGSPLLRELAEPAPGCRTPITAIYSNLDEMVVPTSSGRCEHPDLETRNVLVRGIGHMSLPMNRAVADEVAATLAGVAATPRPARPPPSPEPPCPGPAPASQNPVERHVDGGRWVDLTHRYGSVTAPVSTGAAVAPPDVASGRSSGRAPAPREVAPVVPPASPGVLPRADAAPSGRRR